MFMDGYWRHFYEALTHASSCLVTVVFSEFMRYFKGNRGGSTSHLIASVMFWWGWKGIGLLWFVPTDLAF